MLALSAIVTGLGLGAMYGLLALGFHVTYAVSRTVNFSQGSTMMLGAVLAYTFTVTLGWPGPLGIAAALIGCAIYGLAVERFLALRDSGLQKTPSTGELLVWLRALAAVGNVSEAQLRDTDPTRLPYLGVLLKNRRDLLEAD